MHAIYTRTQMMVNSSDLCILSFSMFQGISLTPGSASYALDDATANSKCAFVRYRARTKRTFSQIFSQARLHASTRVSLIIDLMSMKH